MGRARNRNIGRSWRSRQIVGQTNRQTDGQTEIQTEREEAVPGCLDIALTNRGEGGVGWGLLT